MPWVIEPESRVTVPPLSKRTSAASNPPAAARSMVLERPMPRSRPRAWASARRAPTPETKEISVLGEPQFGLGDMVAGLRVGEEGFGARAGPFDGPAEHFGGEHGQRPLVIDRRFHPEAAADIAGDDADLALGHLH